MARLAVAALTLVCTLAPATSAGADGTVHPGDFIRFDSGSNNIWCTAAFVFDGLGAHAGKVFMGTAAHCIQKPGGQEVTVGSGPENGTTDVAGTTGGTEVLGRIVAQGSTAAVDGDWALIEVRPEMVPRVRPELRRYPEHPSGVAVPDDMAAYDVLEHVGYGIPFFVHPLLRDERQGLFLRSDGRVFESLLAVYGGDSGGPIVHGPSGKAVGILNGYFCSTVPPDCVVHGSTVAETIRQAAAQGFTVQLRAAGQSAPPLPPAEPEQEPAPAQPAPAPAAQPPQPRPAAPASRKKSSRSCVAKAKKLRGAKRRRALRRCRARAR